MKYCSNNFMSKPSLRASPHPYPSSPPRGHAETRAGERELFTKPVICFFIALLLLLLPAGVWAGCVEQLENLTRNDFPDIADCDMSAGHIISGSLCAVQAILAMSMFEMYCHLSDIVVEPLKAAITLYIVLYTLAYVMGLNPKGGRDAPLRIIQILILWALAFDPMFFYHYLYEMFMNLLNGVSEALIGFAGDQQSNFEAGSGQSFQVGVFNHVDTLFGQILGMDTLLNYGMAVIVLLFVPFIGPPIALLLVTALISLVMLFLRILITYVTAVMGLLFLLMFTPLFVGFWLFTSTRKVFLTWMQHLISYTVQPLIVLGYLFLMSGLLDMGQAMTDTLYINKNLPRGTAEGQRDHPDNQKVVPNAEYDGESC